MPAPTDEELLHGVPIFLDQLTEALRLGQMSTEAIGETAGLHAHDLRGHGFTLSQVVHDYGDVCQAITELALERGGPISTKDFRTLNACLDDAIAMAVTQYAREDDMSAAAAESARGHQRLGFFAHELRNLLQSATLAFRVLKTGNVGVGGSTGAVLERNLAAASELIDRSLTEVRLHQEVQKQELIIIGPFIRDLEHDATLAASARGVAFTVGTVAPDLAVSADRHTLGGVLMNLIQNAIKFTQPYTDVQLRVSATDECVAIEIEDRCGGLTLGSDSEQLFRPFEQRNVDRSGLGLGLAFCRWGVAANRGTVSVTDRAGVGCIFRVELPRVHAGVGATA
ncbi:MAG: HAMP domain-containing sensor histidine kinase [Vicinamibacterales bacterium]